MENDSDDRVQLLSQEQEESEIDTAEPKNETTVAEVHQTTEEAAATTSIDTLLDVTETSAGGESEKEKDHEMQEEGSLISDIKIESVVIGQENESDNDNKMKQQTTLLKHALAYRQQNPEKWLQSQVENVKQVQESYGIYEEDPFIEAYYKRQEELKVEAEKMEEIRKTLPATLSLQLEFNNPRSRKERSNFVETYASMAADGISIYDDDNSFFDRFKNRKDEERGKEPELLITVSKGKNLQNALKNENLKLKNCRLKCKFYPDCLKHGPKLKTSYIHCNLKGSTRWNHVFVLKGFSAKELATKHVVLELVGKTDDGKVVLGEAVLAGRHAQVLKQGSSSIFRPPMPEECTHWEQALRKPGSNVPVTINMSPSQTLEKEGLSTKLAEKMKHEFGNTKISLNSNNNNNNCNNNNCNMRLIRAKSLIRTKSRRRR